MKLIFVVFSVAEFTAPINLRVLAYFRVGHSADVLTSEFPGL